MIHIKNWRNMFSDKILELGYKYYLNKSVKNLEYIHDVMIADVEGANTYKVSMAIYASTINGIYCDCAKAQNGYRCEHMAAFLFQCEEDHFFIKTSDMFSAFEIANNQSDFTTKLHAVEDVVASRSLDDIRSFLISQLMTDDEMLNSFYQIMREKDFYCRIKKIRYYLNDIIERHNPKDFESDDSCKYALALKIIDYLNEKSKPLIYFREYKETFKLTVEIFYLLTDMQLNNEDGSLGLLFEEIYNIWSDLLIRVRPKLKREMFDWFVNNLDGSMNYYEEEYLIKILYKDFQEEEYYEEKFDLTNKRLEKAKSIENPADRAFAENIWAIIHLDMVNIKNNSLQLLKESVSEYWSFPDVRKRYIDICIDNKEYDIALEVIEESLLLDKDNEDLVFDFDSLRKEIYFLKSQE